MAEIEIAAFENMTLATAAPQMHPTAWNGQVGGRVPPAQRPPKLASTNDTTGLKWPPEIGPNIKMIANSPAAVAAAFSNSSKPTLPGDSC